MAFDLAFAPTLTHSSSRQPVAAGDEARVLEFDGTSGANPDMPDDESSADVTITDIIVLTTGIDGDPDFTGNPGLFSANEDAVPADESLDGGQCSYILRYVASGSKLDEGINGPPADASGVADVAIETFQSTAHENDRTIVDVSIAR